MKKYLILLTVVLVAVFGLAGCGQGEAEKADETIETAVVTAILADIYNEQQWEMAAEDLSAFLELLPSADTFREDALAGVDCQYRIEISDGNMYLTDGVYLEWHSGDTVTAVNLTDGSEKLLEIISHYTAAETTTAAANYDMSGNPIIVYTKTADGWQALEVMDKAAKKLETVLNIEELQTVDNMGSEIYCYIDFMNGTLAEIFTDETGNVYSGADSEAFAMALSEGSTLTTALKAEVTKIKFPADTIKTVKEALANPAESWE